MFGRSIGKAEDVVSIPSFGLEQLNLQHCKSQDEVEAELAKRVGVGIPGQVRVAVPGGAAAPCCYFLIDGGGSVTHTSTCHPTGGERAGESS